MSYTIFEFDNEQLTFSNMDWATTNKYPVAERMNKTLGITLEGLIGGMRGRVLERCLEES